LPLPRDCHAEFSTLKERKGIPFGVPPSGGPGDAPYCPDDAESIVRLRGQAITVSLNTTNTVKGLPSLKAGGLTLYWELAVPSAQV
jgi:hypothetical protein